MSHSCAITAAGDAWCWGSSVYGKLGDGSAAPIAVPVLVNGGYRFAAIAAGGNHSCAATDARAIFCWGRNASGQLGAGSTSDALEPVAITPVAAF